jgi:hypothetical protein
MLIRLCPFCGTKCSEPNGPGTSPWFARRSRKGRLVVGHFTDSAGSLTVVTPPVFIVRRSAFSPSRFWRHDPQPAPIQRSAQNGEYNLKVELLGPDGKSPPNGVIERTFTVDGRSD